MAKARSLAMAGVPGFPNDMPSTSNVESQPIMIAGKSICSRTVWALVTAKAITISAGVIELKKSVSSSTPLTITTGDRPAPMSNRLREVDCEARTIFGIIYFFPERRR